MPFTELVREVEHLADGSLDHVAGDHDVAPRVQHLVRHTQP
jgi:hypothetical protein